MRIIYRGCRKHIYFVCFSLFIIWFLIERTEHSLHRKQTHSKKIRFERPYVVYTDSGLKEGAILNKISWEDKEQASKDANRQGIAEQSIRAKVPDDHDPKKYRSLWDINGFNALLSEYISLDRALKDIRHNKCSSLLYSDHLPTASVVIPFFEEHLITLQRTVASVVNRSPPQFLKEVILVDDGSTMNKLLNKPLEDWLNEFLPFEKFNLVRLPERVGLIAARMAGANVAKGDVIIVLDSHCEAMVNWLVPLLEPILKNHRTVVSPLIDIINNQDFSYYPQDNGGRGGFDWRFFYKRMPLLPDAEKNLPEPFENPVMNGGLFAISRKFFKELGGYDPGIKIWGGEQYELSFKIWQCGGRLLDAPCSRVGHVFRGPAPKRPGKAGNFGDVNYKRVAKVWMGDYINALYIRNHHMERVNPGDLSRQIEIRDRLECKSFDWFLHEVAPDILKYYPPYEPPDYANGTIKSLFNSNICLDKGGGTYGPVIPYSCHGNLNQVFRYCWRKTIKITDEQFCFVGAYQLGGKLELSHCQNIVTPSNHKWNYDLETNQLREEGRGNCLTLAEDINSVSLETCDSNNPRQGWKFSVVNSKLIKEVNKF